MKATQQQGRQWLMTLQASRRQKKKKKGRVIVPMAVA